MRLDWEEVFDMLHQATAEAQSLSTDPQYQAGIHALQYYLYEHLGEIDERHRKKYSEVYVYDLEYNGTHS